MVKWEYKQIFFVDVKDLDRAGDEGWELVCAGGKNNAYLFFKRPIAEKKVISEDEASARYRERI